ncbi:hypothetical protein BU23DRAFT_603886 [Bimuria novae-zelandiae CBS 107.79]|uniref:Uncharacterized protein n=1 Tax=Bimuria novae-zelandiae CBS 107.79 TaxID=1447943 RepID=A0A6A5UMS1_9PLEO|nr:hypothetical protein BU23DRAFT_603886 [Bimuria novae-zelandiae CBS 107.79]
MSSAGTKFTSTDATKNEPTGLVTSDSLAGESLKSGGAFAADNPHAAASKQPSASTTSNTTDTSSATKLPPAVDAEAREAQEGWSETSQLNAAKGLGKEDGVGPTYNVGGTAGVASGRSGDGGFNPGSEAPTGGYAGASERARGKGELRPHGANITEDPNMSGETKFGEVGTKEDPSRAAELDRQKRDALPGGAGAGAAGEDYSAQKGESKFSGLGEARA